MNTEKAVETIIDDKINVCYRHGNYAIGIHKQPDGVYFEDGSGSMQPVLPTFIMSG